MKAFLTTFVLLTITLSALPVHIAVSDPTPRAPAPSILNAVNAYRASKHRPALRLNPRLERSAQAKSNDLVANHYWSHIAPSGTTPWSFFKAAGYDFTRAGENLARCFKSDDEVVAAWINSPTHERVMTDDYKDVGFGTAHSEHDECDYVTAHFGSSSKN